MNATRARAYSFFIHTHYVDLRTDRPVVDKMLVLVNEREGFAAMYGPLPPVAGVIWAPSAALRRFWAAGLRHVRLPRRWNGPRGLYLMDLGAARRLEGGVPKMSVN